MAKFKGPDTRAMLEAGRSGGEFAYRGAKARLEEEQRGAESVQRGLTKGAEMLQRQGELESRKEALAKSMGLQERKVSLEEAKAGFEYRKPGQGPAPGPDQQAEGAQAPPGTQPGGAGAVAGGGVQPPGQERMDKEDLSYEQGRGFHVMRPEEKQRRQQVMQVKRSELAIKQRNAESTQLNALTGYHNALGKSGDEGRKERAKHLLRMDEAVDGIQDTIDKVSEGKVDVDGLASAFADNPAMQQAAASGDDAQTMAIGMRLLKVRRDTMGLRYTAESGKLWTTFEEDSSVGRTFNQMLPRMKQALTMGTNLAPGGTAPELQAEFAEESGGLTAHWKGLKNDTDRSRFARKTLARLMLESQARRGAAETNMELMGLRQTMQQQTDLIRQYQETFGQIPNDQSGTTPNQQPGAGQDPGAFVPSGQLGDIPGAWKQAR